MHFATYHMSYLEIPLLARIIPPLPGIIKYHADLGPTLGVLLDADLVLADGQTLDADRSIESLDIGVMLGAGAAVEIGDRGTITLDIRYNRGLLNFDKTAVMKTDELMNQSVYFMVGYRTNLDDLLQRFRRQAPPTNTQPTPASPTGSGGAGPKARPGAASTGSDSAGCRAHSSSPQPTEAETIRSKRFPGCKAREALWGQVLRCS